MDPLAIRIDSEQDSDSVVSEEQEEQVEFDFEFENVPIKKFEWNPVSAITNNKTNSRLTQKVIEKHKNTLDLQQFDVMEGEDITSTNNVTSHGNTSHSNANINSDTEEQDLVKEKKKAEFFTTIEDPLEQMETFHQFQLSRPLLKAISQMGYVKPTGIQERAIPLALEGKDICGSAVTGSGKTAAFMIPILERLLHRPKTVAATRVLVLVPTRELGAQCHAVCTELSKFSTVQACLCVGGLPVKQQEVQLRQKPDIVIATPGRLIDHIHNSPTFTLDQIEILVIDEADRILEDGFKQELNEIIKNTPVKRQTMLFSATMTDNVDELIALSLKYPVRLFVDTATSMTSKLVQEFVRVREHREDSRPAILAALCSRTYTKECLVFFRSKAAVHHMRIIFGLLGLKAAELHGNLTQQQRLESLQDFRDKKVDFLLATDLASRGLDITGIKTVINYDMPTTYPVYVHRCGRTARGNAAGRAVSLVGEQDRPILKLALKNSRDAVKHRVVPSQVLLKFEKCLASFQDTVKKVYEDEKVEKQLSIAEMEMKRAENLLTFEDEIKSRPRREWFQTEKERQEGKTQNTAKVIKKEKENISAEKPKRGAFDGLSRHKKRLMIARKEDKKEIAQQKVAASKSKSATKGNRIKKFAENSNLKTTRGTFKKQKLFDVEMRKPKRK